MEAITISKGFAQEEREEIAKLYWQAFEAKLRIPMGPAGRGCEFFERAVNPDYAICARNSDGRLLGLAGFKTSEGMFTDGTILDLAAVYGWFSLAWRLPILMLMERPVEAGAFLMDGIVVTAAARGKGVGSKLLDAITAEAVARGLDRVRLDVIDTNPRARSLYERKGFEAGATTHLGPFRWLFGFESSTTMTMKVTPQRP